MGKTAKSVTIGPTLQSCPCHACAFFSAAEIAEAALEKLGAWLETLHTPGSYALLRNGHSADGVPVS